MRRMLSLKIILKRKKKLKSLSKEDVIFVHKLHRVQQKSFKNVIISCQSSLCTHIKSSAHQHNVNIFFLF